MRVLVRGNEILDTWDDCQKSALKIQASRIAILPVRLSSVTMKPKEHEAKSEGWRTRINKSLRQKLPWSRIKVSAVTQKNTEFV